MKRDERQSAQSRIADHASCELQEGQVDNRPTLVAHGEPLEVPEPGEGPLHNPAVLPELLRRFDATPRNPRKDAPDLAGDPASLEVVGFVRIKLPEPVPWPPPFSVVFADWLSTTRQKTRFKAIQTVLTTIGTPSMVFL